MRNSNPDDYLGKPLKEILDAIAGGLFGAQEELTHLVNTIRWNNDHYLVSQDFYSYIEA